MNKSRIPVDIQFLAESVLSESPDGIENIPPTGDSVAWRDGDAWAFMIFEHSSIIGAGYTHGELIELVLYGLRYDKLEATFGDLEYVHVSSAAGIKKDAASGRIGKYIKAHGYEKPIARVYRNEFGLTGRIWVTTRNRNIKHVMSFWNKRHEVIKHWPAVEQLFIDHADVLGKIDDYLVEFIEREFDSTEELVSAKTISSSKQSQPPPPDDQLSFFDKLEKNKISSEKIKQVQEKLHLMDPKQKKEALVAMGAMNHKAADIAEKLGMTVAEYNHIMHINEEDAPIPSMAEIARAMTKQ